MMKRKKIFHSLKLLIQRRSSLGVGGINEFKFWYIKWQRMLASSLSKNKRTKILAAQNNVIPI